MPIRSVKKPAVIEADRDIAIRQALRELRELEELIELRMGAIAKRLKHVLSPAPSREGKVVARKMPNGSVYRVKLGKL